MLELNQENFEAEVLNYNEKPVIIDFWGEKCERCRQLMPGMKELEKKYQSSIKFCELNTTEYRKLAIKERVLGLPTMIIYINGEKKEVLTPNKISSIEDVEKLIADYASVEL